ncbi:MAG: hypothetical protein NUV52_03510 [Candidatus Roizmanbacteria bacterium]|nr:hypothetical protein [Candidatus Roizmanbacteria bacterium]
MAVTVKKLSARKIFDSLGFPTLAGIMWLSDGRMVEASIANSQHNGEFAGEYMYDETDHYLGKGVDRSLQYVNDLIAPKLIGIDANKSREIDEWLKKSDPSERKEVLGVNTTFLISELFYKASALLAGQELYVYLNSLFAKMVPGGVPLARVPSPIFTMISGGNHGAKTLNFQEFSMVPSTGRSYEQALDLAFNLYHGLSKVFAYRNIFAGIGNDGAYIPSLASNIDAYEIIREAMLKSNIKVGVDVYFAMDIAAEFFFKGKYYLSDSPNPLNTDQFLERLNKLNNEYRSLILEDPCAIKDEAGWKKITATLGERAYIAADDLIQTNMNRLEYARKNALCNAVCVKPLQRGTVSEALEFAAAVRKAGMRVILSQMAAETEDSFIADFSVALQADFVKFGSITRGERLAKHNRMLQIETDLRKHA